MGAAIKNNQVEYHPLINQKKLKNWQDTNNIALTAYCPLAQGRIVQSTTVKKAGRKIRQRCWANYPALDDAAKGPHRHSQIQQSQTP